MFRIMWTCVLLIGATLGSFAQEQGGMFLEQPADVVIYKEGGKTYAQVSDRRLANFLKIKAGSIIAGSDENLSDAEVIQKAINTVHQIYKDMESDRGNKGIMGKILLKNGVYKLGKQGIIIPRNWPCAVEGEDRGKTVLEYAGDGIALGFDKEELALSRADPKCIFEVRKLTIRITGNAEAGIFSAKIETDYFSDISIIAADSARPKYGIWIFGGEGHLRYMENISVKGPFETGISAGVAWFSMFNVEVEGFRKYGITTGQRIFLARLKTDWPEAEAGVACTGGKMRGGMLRCLNRMVFFKTPYQRDDWIRGGGFAVAMNVEDNSPRLKNYRPFLAQDNYLSLAGCKATIYKKSPYLEKGRGRIFLFDEELNWLLPDFRSVAERLSRPEPEIDIIVFKDEQDKTCCQVVSKRLVKKMGMTIGHFIKVDKDEDLIQKALDSLPRGGKLYLKQGIYKAGALQIPWDKEITIEGRGCAGAWWNMGTTLRTKGITFKDVRKSAKKLPLFFMKHLRVEGAINLPNTRAILNNLVVSGGIVIDGGQEVALLNVWFMGEAVSIDDRGEKTVIINPGLGYVKLGPQAALLGQMQGHVATNPLSVPERPTEKWRRDNSVLVAGMQVEGPGHLLANGPDIYLFCCSGPEGPFVTKETREETNGGKIIVIKKGVGADEE